MNSTKKHGPRCAWDDATQTGLCMCGIIPPVFGEKQTPAAAWAPPFVPEHPAVTLLREIEWSGPRGAMLPGVQRRCELRPLITLCMMVKNEAHTIARTLRSAKPWIDRWCIFDTGSTDGTGAIVLEEMSGVIGSLYQEPFIDFAATRNALLERVAGASDFGVFSGFGCGEFLLLLDADDVLEGGEALRRALDVERQTLAPSADAFYVRMRKIDAVWDSTRVVRASAVGPNGWHYVGAVHEVLVKDGAPSPVYRIADVQIRHDVTPKGEENSKERWGRDIVELEARVYADPKDARAWFYLAQTNLWLGRTDPAWVAFGARIKLGGWHEEIYECHMARGRIALGANNVQEAITEFGKAYLIKPHRAEPLEALARIHDQTREYPLSYLYARRGYELPFPNGVREGHLWKDGDHLFIDASVYEWRMADLTATAAYWLNEWQIGEQAARQAVEQGPPGDERLARNLQFFTDRKA